MSHLEKKSESPFFREFLLQELTRRKGVNRAYSLRAFAKAMNLNPATLSQILSGKANPTLRTTKKILEAISIDSRNRRRFIHSVIATELQKVLGSS